MKSTTNKAPNASKKIVDEARLLGIKADIIKKSRPSYRRYDPMGSTFAPQKVVELNGIRMSLGQARQYVAARRTT